MTDCQQPASWAFVERQANIAIRQALAGERQRPRRDMNRPRQRKGRNRPRLLDSQRARAKLLDHKRRALGDGRTEDRPGGRRDHQLKRSLPIQDRSPLGHERGRPNDDARVDLQAALRQLDSLEIRAEGHA